MSAAVLAPDDGRAPGRAGSLRSVVAPLGRVQEPVGRLLGIVRPAGWVTIVLAALAWIVGRRLGWLELSAVSITAAALLLGAVVLVLGRTAHDVSLELAVHRVTAGGRAGGRLLVENPTRRPLLPAIVQLPVGAGTTEVRLPRLTPQGRHEEVFSIPTTRRGVFQVGPVSSVRGDPLGLLSRQVTWGSAQDLYVHPRTVPLDGAAAGFLRDIEGVTTQDLSSNDVSFHALRDYQAGDDRRSIHWPTTARTGTLMVRQFEETRRSHVVVALSTRSSDYADPEEFELAVSVAASVGLQTLREDKPLTMLGSAGAIPTRTPGTLLDEHASIRTDPEHDDIGALARTAGVTVPGASTAALVLGSGAEPAALRLASTRLPLGVHVVLVRCVPDHDLTRAVLGGVPVLTVGELADLPRGLRAVSR